MPGSESTPIDLPPVRCWRLRVGSGLQTCRCRGNSAADVNVRYLKCPSALPLSAPPRAVPAPAPPDAVMAPWPWERPSPCAPDPTAWPDADTIPRPGAAAAPPAVDPVLLPLAFARPGAPAPAPVTIPFLPLLGEWL